MFGGETMANNFNSRYPIYLHYIHYNTEYQLEGVLHQFMKR